MEFIEVKSIVKLLLGSRIIGGGTTSVCFLLSNGEVLKLYIDTPNKNHLFAMHDMEEHLKYLNSIINKSYVGPLKVYIKDDKVIGYSMNYIKGRLLKHISPNIKLNDLVKAFDKLIEDTIIISNKKFRLVDLHNKNVIYNGLFYIFDLDFGYDKSTYYDQGRILQYNITDILIVLQNSIFKCNSDVLIDYKISELNDLEHRTIYEDYRAYQEFFIKLKEYLNCDNPSIRDLRRKKDDLILEKVNKIDN